MSNSEKLTKFSNKIKELVLQGYKSPYIKEKLVLGSGVKAVRKFINKNLKLTATELKNIPGNPLGKNQIGVFKATPALIKKLKNEAKDQILSTTEIKKKYGIPRTTMKTWKKKYGLNFVDKSRLPKPETTERMIKLQNIIKNNLKANRQALWDKFGESKDTFDSTIDLIKRSYDKSREGFKPIQSMKNRVKSI